MRTKREPGNCQQIGRRAVFAEKGLGSSRDSHERLCADCLCMPIDREVDGYDGMTRSHDETQNRGSRFVEKTKIAFPSDHRPLSLSFLMTRPPASFAHPSLHEKHVHSKCETGTVISSTSISTSSEVVGLVVTSSVGHALRLTFCPRFPSFPFSDANDGRKERKKDPVLA